MVDIDSTTQNSIKTHRMFCQGQSIGYYLHQCMPFEHLAIVSRRASQLSHQKKATLSSLAYTKTQYNDDQNSKTCLATTPHKLFGIL